MSLDGRAGSTRARRLLVASPFLAGAVAAIAIATAWSDQRLSADVWMSVAGILTFTSLGALIEARRPGHIVGRICLVSGWLLIASTLIVPVVFALDTRVGQISPLGVVLAGIGSTCYSLALLLSGPLLISRFPDGRERGRLAGLVDVLVVVMGVATAVRPFQPGLIQVEWISEVPNPLGMSWLPSLESDFSRLGFFVLYALTMVLAALGLIRRYRHGGQVVRAQVRWFAASIGVSVALLAVLLLSGGIEPLNSVAWNVWAVSLFLPAGAIGVAILRYRLYDIDRIVSNAIGYGLVTLVLVTVFVVVNLALVSRLSPLISNEGPAVAASTLLVAAMFNPLRIRVQRAVDRRFHRAHYDAERTVADFAVRLRDELDLPTLAIDLSSTTALAVQPTSSALWLRARGER